MLDVVKLPLFATDYGKMKFENAYAQREEYYRNRKG